MLPAWSLVAQPVAERSTRTHTPKQPPPARPEPPARGARRNAVRLPPRPAATPARAAPRALAPWAQVDDDQNETISIGEWLDFWKNVLAQDCYTEEDIAEAGELV